MKLKPDRSTTQRLRSSGRSDATPDLVDVDLAQQVERLIYPPSLALQIDVVAKTLASANTSPRALLFGPPGFGKTATLRNWAAMSRRPFWRVRHERLFSSFLGGTSSNLASLFRSAAAEKAVLVFDDFDAFARRRDDPREGGESRRTVVALLGALDDFDQAVAVLAATNLPESVDPAVIRRFDSLLEFRALDSQSARNLLSSTAHLRRVPKPLVRLAQMLSPAEVVSALQSELNNGKVKDLAVVLKSRTTAIKAIGARR